MQKDFNRPTKWESSATYAKSPEMIDTLAVAAAQERVLRALSELLHNPETPQKVWEDVANFVCEQPNTGGNDEIFHQSPRAE